MADLKPEHRVFAEQYVIDWNGTRSYQVAYPGSSYESSKSSASELLTNPNLLAYIKEIQKDLGKLAGVSALRNVLELKKLAYTNITDLKDGWLTVKEFEELDSDVKAALSEIQYTIKGTGKNREEIVKFKLHDKLKAIEGLNKMLGYNAPEKGELVIDNKTLTEDERKARILELQTKLNKKD